MQRSAGKTTAEHYAQPGFDFDGGETTAVDGGAVAGRSPDAGDTDADGADVDGSGRNNAVGNDAGTVASDDDAAVSPVNERLYSEWAAAMLQRLGTSKFRAKFVLSDKDRAYARAKGRLVIVRHAHEMLAKRVGPAVPYKDGKQTPWRGHPVFTAQHATATCCRGCIEKWHHIPRGRQMTDEEIDRLTTLVMAWIDRDLTRHPQ